MKERKRKVELNFSPEVTQSSYSGMITIKTGGWQGATKYECAGELSMNCAASLIVQLRTAMRALRAERVASMDYAINKAEKPL